jgi:hypothetical protein
MPRAFNRFYKAPGCGSQNCIGEEEITESLDEQRKKRVPCSLLISHGEVWGPVASFPGQKGLHLPKTPEAGQSVGPDSLCKQLLH